MAKKLSPEELRLIEILEDPAKWIEYTTGESPRAYQIEMLRSKALHKVSRCGRRIGKTWTMAAHALWYAFTHENARMVIAAPYENQVALIFDQIRKFIKKAPEIDGSLLTDRRNPQQIQLGNGSWIRGFTAGTKSGAAGGSLRGQGADWIYMDEVDYMTDDDFDTIYAISLEAPARIGVWISSTPTGRRGMFWKCCTGVAKGWTEFYFPSTVNPEWDEKMEAELRSMFSTQVAWEHEVLAEFGDETIGVFKKEFIDRARQEYKYVDHNRMPAWRTMGVDWDKYGAETQIVVMEYDQEVKKFRVIHRSEIPRSQFTLDNAVNKIIKLNEMFNPQAIYVDRGYGEYQVERLHLYGSKHPQSGLDKKVKGWAFNQSYEVLDPITKEARNTPIKPFMVNQVVYFLEQDLLILSEYDDLLWRQMENYQVIRTTVTGQPVFTSENEHTIDALMLATLAFQLEFPQLADIIKEAVVARLMLGTKLKKMDPLNDITKGSVFNTKKDDAVEWDEPGSPPPRQVPVGYNPKRAGYSWGPRGTSRGEPFRKKW